MIRVFFLMWTDKNKKQKLFLEYFEQFAFVLANKSAR